MTEALREGDHYTAVGHMDPRMLEAPALPQRQHLGQWPGTTARGRHVAVGARRWSRPGCSLTRRAGSGCSPGSTRACGCGLPDAPTTRAKVPAWTKEGPVPHAWRTSGKCLWRRGMHRIATSVPPSSKPAATANRVIKGSVEDGADKSPGAAAPTGFILITAVGQGRP